MKLMDYECDYDSNPGFSSEIIMKTKLSFPDAYKDAEGMALLAIEVRKEKGGDFCLLPFCRTVEAENMGGIINYGNGQLGPRAKDYLCENVEQLLELPSLDFSKGRMAQVLQACTLLKEQGETVALEICGPFTVMNSLIDVRLLFKVWRKNPTIVQQLLQKFAADILSYFEAAVKAGVDFPCYADSAGGLNILGPKYMQEVTETFTYPLLKKLEQSMSKNTLVQLCPKTSFALIGTEMATWELLDLTEVMTIGKACQYARGKANFVGQICFKNSGHQLKNGKIQTVRLK